MGIGFCFVFQRGLPCFCGETPPAASELCGCCYTASKNRGGFCDGPALGRINHCSVCGHCSKCSRHNPASLVREVISRDLDVSFAFSVERCVRWAGIFLGANFCSVHFWEKYSVLCLDVATSRSVCRRVGCLAGQKVAVAGRGQVKVSDR